MTSKWQKRGALVNESIMCYQLRIDRNLFRKFRYVAEYEGHSANKEIVRLVKMRVKRFEEKHGEIKFE